MKPNLMSGTMTCLALGLACAGGALVLQRFERGTCAEVELSAGETVEIADRTLVLDAFSVPKYPSGRPRQFVCDVRLLGGERELHREISVNHPLRYGDYWVYQQSYDPISETTTVLRVVRDPWLTLAAIGGVLLLVGALLSLGLLQGSWTRLSQSRQSGNTRPSSTRLGQTRPRGNAWLRILAGGLTVLLPLFIIGRAVLRPEPVPALQSPFLAPHVAAYATSYVILLFATFGIGKRLVPLGFFLMTVGLVLGAVWGKVCWGNWWQYDPKEMWSFATWCVYAAYLPIRGCPRLERTLRIAGAVLIVLTLTWVNFSRIFSGLHNYA